MDAPKGFPIEHRVWEDQYRTGRWDYLGSLPEMGRYAMIAAYIERYCERPRVLDVGGGEGILFQHLDAARLETYTSVDIASSSFERSRVPTGKASFVEADMETYEPEGQTFNCAVFTEVLYYAKAPMQLLERTAQWIEPPGVMVVSMWHAPDGTPIRRTCDAIWRAIDKGAFKSLDETAVTNVPTGRVWRIRALEIPA